MIVVYADGGGLGHLTRVQALRHTLGLTGEVTSLTSSHHVDDVRVADGLRIVPIRIRRDDLAARRSWLHRTLADLAPDQLIVDAFPAGLAGEIDGATVPDRHRHRAGGAPAALAGLPADLPDRPCTTTARTSSNHWTRTTTPTSGPTASGSTVLDLVDPPAPTAPEDGAGAWADAAGSDPCGRPRPRWLIAHTGRAAEIVELVAYAREQAVAEGVVPRFVVASSPDASAAGRRRPRRRRPLSRVAAVRRRGPHHHRGRLQHDAPAGAPSRPPPVPRHAAAVRRPGRAGEARPPRASRAGRDRDRRRSAAP